MAEEIKKKPGGNKNSGKQPYQRLKPYIIYDYLMHNSDEAHTVKASRSHKEKVEDDTSIQTYLDTLGISSERRSVYKDIEEMNQMLLVLDGLATDMDEAAELCQDEENCAIRYDAKTRGYYVHQRKYSLEDIRLLAECVYTSKFIDEDKSDELIEDILMQHVSIYEAEKIQHDAYLTDRVRTDNTSTYNNVQIISGAMSKTLNGKKHIPEKIKFKYLKYNIKNMSKRVERRSGDDYTVSPFCLMINDGNYYLLARDDKSGKMRTFRVDRMRNIRLTNLPREGEEEFKSVRLSDYAKEHFSMFDGQEEHVCIRFLAYLLDAVVDRFGTRGVVYSRDEDERYLRATFKVAVNDPFFAWVFGFGRRMKIVSPPSVVERYKEHLNKVRNMYE